VKSLWQSDARKEIEDRVRSLSPEAQPRFGRLNAPRMLNHIADQMRMALGDIHARNGAGWLSVWPFNYLAIYVLPWPHGFKGPREAFTTKPVTWDADREQLLTLIGRFCEKQEQQSWPEHPVFGKLSGNDWAALSYRHLSHHLGQFGG